MTPTHVELYEALKPSVGEAAAAMIAEVVPPARDVATKADLDAGFATVREESAKEFGRIWEEFAKVRGELATFRGEVREEFAKVRGELHAETNRTIKWIVGVFVPIMAATWGTMFAVLLKS